MSTPSPAGTSERGYGKRGSVREWWSGTTGLMVSGIFLAVVLAGGIWIVLVPPGVPAENAQQSAVEAPSMTTDTLDPLPSPMSVCEPRAVIEVAPEQVVTQVYLSAWYPVGTMAAPSSATGGPLDARRCFTRTPEGALYATVTRISEEAARAGLLGASFNGYQWRAFTPERAVLAVQVQVSTAAATRLSVQLFTAVWSENDWLVTPDVSVDAVKSLSDPLRTFIPWGNS